MIDVTVGTKALQNDPTPHACTSYNKSVGGVSVRGCRVRSSHTMPELKHKQGVGEVFPRSRPLVSSDDGERLYPNVPKR